MADTVGWVHIYDRNQLRSGKHHCAGIGQTYGESYFSDHSGNGPLGKTVFPCLGEINIYRPRPLGGRRVGFPLVVPTMHVGQRFSAANNLNLKSAIFITI